MTLNILNGLTAKGWDCHCICHNLAGQTLKKGITFEDNTKINFKLYGAGKQPYSKDKVQYLLNKLKPDIFCVLLDTFMIRNAGYLGMNFSPAKSVFYFPTDGEPRLPHQCENLFLSKTFQYPIAMAKRGQQQVKEAHNINAHYIPHAVNEKLFKPFSRKKQLQNIQKWSQKLQIDLSNKKIIGCVARNQGRKMLDRIIPIIKKINELQPNNNIVMLMHTDPFDGAAYFDMIKEISLNNLDNKFIFTGLNYLDPFTYKELAEIYNLMDLFLLPTTGEGFGVPIIEAMSCKIPCVVTDYTTTPELIKAHNAGYGIKLAAKIMGTENVLRGICDTTDGAEKCLKILNDEKLKKQMGINGREAVLKEYTWNVVIPEWNKYLTKICGDY